MIAPVLSIGYPFRPTFMCCSSTCWAFCPPAPQMARVLSHRCPARDLWPCSRCCCWLRRLVPAGMLRGASRPPRSDTLTWIGLLFLGLFSSLLVLTVLRDPVAAGLVVSLIAREPPRRASSPTAGAVPLLGTGRDLHRLPQRAPHRAQVKTVEIPLAGLPAALEGFTHRADQRHPRRPHHQGALPAGDRRTGERAGAGRDRDHRRPGRRLGAPNCAAHVAPLARPARPPRQLLRHGQPRVLLRRAALDGRTAAAGHHACCTTSTWCCEHDGAQLVLAGVPDYSGRPLRSPRTAATRRPALAGAPAGAVTRAARASAAQCRGGGAGRLRPADCRATRMAASSCRGRFFVPLQQPFTAGLHQLGRMWIYVSRGTGYWGPPKRFGAPSEIARAAPGAVAV